MKINKLLLDTSNYGLKSPKEMTPTYITIHEATQDVYAESLVSWMTKSFSPVSFHYAVDHKEVWQGIEDSRIAFHCGHGIDGIGNNNSIGIEICCALEEGNNFYKAIDKAVELTAFLMEKHNIPLKNVVQHNHWSFKDCPKRIRKEGLWNEFLKKVKERRKKCVKKI